jgi:hypothetical protein
VEDDVGVEFPLPHHPSSLWAELLSLIQRKQNPGPIVLSLSFSR